MKPGSRCHQRQELLLVDLWRLWNYIELLPLSFPCTNMEDFISRPSKMTSSDLWCLVVHGGDADVEGDARDGASMLVADGEDKLDQQYFWPNVLHGRHEGNLPVMQSMLGETGQCLSVGD